jgi:uncharacterized protein (DUF1800 family)
MSPRFSSLEKVDPADAWKPWQPSSAEPWSRKWAAHLLRRAAFGYSRDELIEAERLGPEGTLELLLEGRPQATEVLETLVDVGKLAAERDEGGDQLQGWWLYCMLHGGHPLREKLTLFWHNHFATSLVKVQSPALLFRQNCLLREHALGKFGPMLQAISRDGAMLVWLDSNSNVKGKPNENYARELMELFSLGVGNYTEKDVREGARAFTGWRTDGRGFVFDPRFHDTAPKTFLGKTGNWDGGDIVRIVLEQPAAARFLTRKLYQQFISETAAPSDVLLEPLCKSFRKSDYDIAALVRTMLASRHFYSAHAFRQRVKCPVEFALGAVQAVYRRYREDEPEYHSIPQQMLLESLAAQGQSLFAPPNVKGWPGGKAWLNTATLLERANLAESVAMGTLWADHTAASDRTPPPPVVFDLRRFVSAITSSIIPRETPEEPAPPGAFDSARILHEEQLSRPDDVVRTLLDLHLSGGVRPETEAKLEAFIAQGSPKGHELDRRVREAVHGILTLAEYQLC